MATGDDKGDAKDPEMSGGPAPVSPPAAILAPQAEVARESAGESADVEPAPRAAIAPEVVVEEDPYLVPIDVRAEVTRAMFEPRRRAEPSKPQAAPASSPPEALMIEVRVDGGWMRVRVESDGRGDWSSVAVVDGNGTAVSRSGVVRITPPTVNHAERNRDVSPETLPTVVQRDLVELPRAVSRVERRAPSNSTDATPFGSGAMETTPAASRLATKRICKLLRAEERTLRDLAAHGSAQEARRARTLLALAEGRSAAHVATDVGVHPSTVSRWRRTFLDSRLTLVEHARVAMPEK